LDIKAATISTILACLEVERYIQLFPTVNVTCDLNFYKTQPETLKAKNKVIATALIHGKRVKNQFQFQMDVVADALNVTIADIRDELEKLKGQDEITYSLKDQAYYFRVLKDPELDELIDQMVQKIKDLEQSNLRKIDIAYTTLKDHAFPSFEEAIATEKDQNLHSKINNYFCTEDTLTIKTNDSNHPKNRAFLLGDIRVFLSRNPAINTGRQVARIFHGISSPMFAARDWCFNPFWNRYKEFDFNELVQMATTEIAHFKTK